MALGTTAVLLLLVSSLALMYIRESKLSRFSYDDLTASTNAEWTMEYAMLKVRNHPDGFEDSVSQSEPDGTLLDLSTERSRGITTQYAIHAATNSQMFLVGAQEHLIIPLFTADESLLPLATTSRNPTKTGATKNTNNLQVIVLDPSASWTITAMSGSESIAITGKWDIDAATDGTIRVRARQCYDHSTGDEIVDCAGFDPSAGDEELIYFYDVNESVQDFLSDPLVKNPYFMLFNNAPIDPDDIDGGMIMVQIESDPTHPFTDPALLIETESRKWESVQRYRMDLNKSKYYDALKYGTYMPD
jgi:hypothetical protein